MSTDLVPGKYKAKIVDYGISESKAGLPIVNVRFGFGDHTLNWIGSLNEGKARQITVENLMKMGMTDADSMADMADGPSSGVLNTEKELEIDVQTETYDGKTTLRIKWINELGFRNSMTKDTFKAKLAAMNMKGTFALVKENNKAKGVSSQAKKTDQQVIDELGF